MISKHRWSSLYRSQWVRMNHNTENTCSEPLQNPQNPSYCYALTVTGKASNGSSQFHSYINNKFFLSSHTRIWNSDGLDWYSSNCSILARHKRERLVTQVNWGQFGKYITWFRSSQSQNGCLVRWVDELNVTSPFKGVLLHPSGKSVKSM